MSKFFISYAKKDAFEVAKDLRYRIQEAGLSAWMDDEDIPAGNRWRAVIDEAIDESICMLVVITPGGLQSPHVTREWASAQATGKEIVPVLFADVPLENREHPIFDLQYRDFRIQTAVKWEQLIAELEHIKAKRNIDPEVARAEAILGSHEMDKWDGAIRLLQTDKRESATEALVRVINGNLPDTSIKAAIALGYRTEFSDIRAIPGLRFAVLSQGDQYMEALHHLVKMNCAEAVQCLENIWINDFQQSLEYADMIFALSQFRHESAIPILERLILSENQQIRTYAIIALGEITNSKVVPILVSRIKSILPTNTPLRRYIEMDEALELENLVESLEKVLGENYSKEFQSIIEDAKYLIAEARGRHMRSLRDILG